jgi:GNAT superfamily N-acetyltransferase
MTELAHLHLPAGRVVLREAVSADVPALAALLADDPLGAARERDDPESLGAYLAAFAAIDADPAHLLVVAVDGARIVATLQLSFLPGLARRGVWRAQIEAVRVAGDDRGRGLGRAMLEWAIQESRARGCGLVQLTSDHRRPDAHRFYAGLGFEATHVGFKLTL